MTMDNIKIPDNNDIIKNYIQNLQIPEIKTPQVNPYYQTYGKYGKYVALGQLIAPLITGALGGVLAKGAGVSPAVGIGEGLTAGSNASQTINEQVNQQIKQLLQQQQIDKALEAKAQQEAMKLQNDLVKLGLTLQTKQNLEKMKEQAREPLIKAQTEAKEAQANYYRKMANLNAGKTQSSNAIKLMREAENWHKIATNTWKVIASIDKMKSFDDIAILNPELAKTLQQEMGGQFDKNKIKERLAQYARQAEQNYNEVAKRLQDYRYNYGLFNETQGQNVEVPTDINDLFKKVGEK